jgi:hypothetical protein
MNNDIDAIIEKINHLQRLSTDSGATVHEAASAAAAIQRLLFTYNLTMYEVRLQTKADAPRYGKHTMNMGTKIGTPTNNWKSLLIQYLCMTNFCKVAFYSGTDRCEIVGAAENVEVVNHMFNWLVEELSAAKKRAWKAYDSYYRKEEYVSFHRSFLETAAKTVASRLYAIYVEQQGSSTGSTALVIQSNKEVDEAFESYYGKTKTLKSPKEQHHYTARAMGYQTGKEIQLQTTLS